MTAIDMLEEMRNPVPPWLRGKPRKQRQPPPPPQGWLVRQWQRALRAHRALWSWSYDPPNGHAAPSQIIAVTASRRDMLATDSEGTVRAARAYYMRALATNPEDPKLPRLREGWLAVVKEASRRRAIISREQYASRDAQLEGRRHGPLREFARTLWYGLPFVPPEEPACPEVPYEAEQNRGEWREWVADWEQQGREAAIDHVGSMIPPKLGEGFREWRERLERRRLSWKAETNRAVIERALDEIERELVPRVIRRPYAPPQPARLPSRGRSRSSEARPARRTPTQSARKGQPEAAPQRRQAESGNPPDSPPTS